LICLSGFLDKVLKMCRTSQPIRRVFAVMMTSKTLASPVCLQVFKAQPHPSDLTKLVKKYVKEEVKGEGENVENAFPKLHVVPVDIPFTQLY
jgi:hypothetical protein